MRLLHHPHVATPTSAPAAGERPARNRHAPGRSCIPAFLLVAGVLIGAGPAGQLEGMPAGAEETTNTTLPAAGAQESAGAVSQTAPDSVPTSEPDRYQVFLFSVDQGPEVWELFGHNALLIVNHTTGERLAWNWGLFNFEDSGFLLRFLRGTMRYTMGPMNSDAFIFSYVERQRSVYANEIFLTQEEAAALDAFVRENFLPENRPYIYHYFLDNCSTRVRDALDSVLGGILHERFSDRETNRTFRWHSRRLVQVTGWVDQGLSFLLGMRGDRPITEWEAMFSPMEVMRLLEGVERERPDGSAGPLLGPRIAVFESPRAAAPALPPSFSPIWILIGAALGGAIAGLAILGSRGSRWARAGAAAGTFAWGLFSGTLGLLLVLAWFTDHNFIHWNLNLFYLSPIGLPLAAAGAAVLLRGDRVEGRTGRFAFGCAAVILVLGAISLLLQISPFVAQGNAEVLALALPVNLGVAWGWRELTRRAGGRSTGHG